MELFLNEQSLGRKPAGKEHHYTATYEVPYEPGKLKAAAYRDGEVIGVYELVTAQTVKKLDVRRVTEKEPAVLHLWTEDGCETTVIVEPQTAQ